jgi:hypothetical protein
MSPPSDEKRCGDNREPVVLPYAALQPRRWPAFSPVIIAWLFGGLLLLAAVVVPSFDPIACRYKSEDVCRAMIGTSGRLDSVIMTFRMHMERWPNDLHELVNPPPDAAAKWGGPYVNDIKALNDPWGSPLQYRPPDAPHLSPLLWSLGPDKTDGTSDDIGNAAYESMRAPAAANWPGWLLAGSLGLVCVLSLRRQPVRR